MAKRLSVSLTDEGERQLAQFTRPGPARSQLERALGDHHVDLGSEAAVIRALIEVGAQTLSDARLDIGYADAAVHYAEGDADRRAARRRHLSRTGRQL